MTKGCTISNEQLGALAELVHDRMGLFFPPSRWNSLEAGVVRLAAQNGNQAPGTYAAQLLEQAWSPSQVESLGQVLTIGETGFFRHAEQWELLKKQILPELMMSKGETSRRLRFWSAACSSGEEAYTIAICLEQFFGRASDWQFQITGTDINPAALAKAREATYTDWSFRETPANVREAYFQAAGQNRSRLAPRIRQMASFAHYNLFDDSQPAVDGLSGVDVIFCRNVLIYFSPEKSAQLICRLHEALNPDGWLIVSPAEVPFISEELFAIDRFEETHYFRKKAEMHPDVERLLGQIEPLQRSLLGVVPTAHHHPATHFHPVPPPSPPPAGRTAAGRQQSQRPGTQVGPDAFRPGGL